MAGLLAVIVAFLGLIGPAGSLPIGYTEMAVEEEYYDHHAFAAFFDIFHHRLLSLFYRAWEKHHFVIGFEQACRRTSARDAITRYLLEFIGMGTGFSAKPVTVSRRRPAALRGAVQSTAAFRRVPSGLAV